MNDIESRRKSAQIAEQSKPFATNPHATSGEPWPFKSKPDRPSDKDIINMLQSCYPNTSYGMNIQ